jgi:uncharacterized RDD family membrane protein YckC
VKCPKCAYLGFETGDRCKNCGYDFSLMADARPDRIELDLNFRETDEEPTADWLAQVDTGLGPREPIRAPQLAESVLDLPSPRQVAAERENLPASREASAFRLAGPLFARSADDDGDEPLIKVSPTPRPPLAVRRTPEIPRRSMTTPSRRVEPDQTPPLQFESEQNPAVPPSVRSPVSRVWGDQTRRPAELVAAEVGTRGARAAAAAIDHLLLGSVDLAVVYFTLRMAGLPVDEFMLLPAMPLIAFLLLIKLSYFCAFTAVGGQTIGKMAAHIRVVSADNGPLDAAAALRRTLAGLVSAIPLGLGFLPALLSSDRRALHDRIARTRVIVLKSA